MSKRKHKKIIQSKEINSKIFKVYKVNKNGSIIYRCKYCRISRLKKMNNTIIKLSGHKRNCMALRQSCKYKMEKEKNISNISEEAELNLLNISTYDSTEKYFDIKRKCFDVSNKIEKIADFSILKKNNQFKLNINKINIISLLANVFDRNNNLNSKQEEIGLYYVNKTKILGQGIHSIAYLGEDKYFRQNVAVLEMDIDDYESFYIETFILQRIHNKGNFPNLYNTYEDNEHFYLIENLMGPNIQLLYNLCNKKFDLYTIINIGMDIVKNLKIFHSLGFVHSDLKPDNLVFGNLSYENYERRNEIGIIDFSNSKININMYGKIKFSKNKIRLRGNKAFSSTRALYDLDIGKIDDLKSLFYILIYLYLGNLPWTIKNKNGSHFRREEIKEQRKKLNIRKLCENFPKEFIDLTENIFDINQNIEPDYYYIYNELDKIRIREKSSKNCKMDKFCWIKLFKDYINKNSNIDNNKRKEIKSLLKKYSINLKDYIAYIKED